MKNFHRQEAFYYDFIVAHHPKAVGILFLFNMTFPIGSLSDMKIYDFFIMVDPMLSSGDRR